MSIERRPITSERHVMQMSSREKSVADQLAKRIKKNGDVLDEMRRIRRLKIGGPVSAVGAGLMASYGINLSFALDNLPGAGAILLGTAVAEIAAGKAAKWKERKKTKELLDTQEELSETTGSAVELYRYKEGTIGKKKKQIALRWYGFSDDEAAPHVLRDHLTRVAAIGKEVQAAQVVLPLHSVTRYLTAEQVEAKVTQTQWLKETKKRGVKDKKHGTDELVVVTLDDLGDIVSKIEILDANEPLDSVMKVLGRKCPSHPANALYAHFSINPNLAKERLRLLFMEHIQAKTSDSVSAVEQHGDITVRTSHMRFAKIGRNLRTGRPRALLRSAVQWSDAEFIDLLKQRGISIDHIATVLSHSKKFPVHKVVEVAELAAWMTIEGYDIGLGTGEGLKKTEETNVSTKTERTITLQQRIVDQELGQKVEGKLRRKRVKKAQRDFRLRSSSLVRRTARSTAIVLLGGGLGAGVGIEADSLVTDYHQRKHAIFETLKDADEDWVNNVDTLREEAEQQTTEEMPIAKKAETLIVDPQFSLNAQARRYMVRMGQLTGIVNSSEDLQKYIAENTQKKDCAVCDTQAGNVTFGKNKPLWYIQSFNGMETEGYWVEQAFRAMDWDGVAWKSELSYVDDGNDRAFLSPSQLSLPVALDTKKPLIKVERAINFENIGADYLNPYTYRDNVTVMVIPVLEGTHLVAAQVGNAVPVKEVTLPDGISVITFPVVKGVQKVEYWLAPGDTTPVKATGPVMPEELVTVNNANAIWEKYVGNTIPKDPVQREAFERDYILRHFNYRLAPLPPTRGIYRRDEYMNLALTLKKGNCNIVNNLLILSNPDLLNGVSGFYNKNNPKSNNIYLSGNESHFFAVDAQGIVHDATPSNVLPEEAGFFEENFGEAVLENPADERRQNFTWLFGFGITAALGSAGYFKRRELAENYYQASKLAYSLDIKRTGSNNLAQAYSAFHHELYGKDEWPYPAGAVPLSSDLSGQPASRSEILGHFAAYTEPETVFNFAARARVASVTPMYDKGQRQALRIATRVIRDLGAVKKAEKKLAELKQ